VRAAIRDVTALVIDGPNEWTYEWINATNAGLRDIVGIQTQGVTLDYRAEAPDSAEHIMLVSRSPFDPPPCPKVPTCCLTLDGRGLRLGPFPCPSESLVRTVYGTAVVTAKDANGNFVDLPDYVAEQVVSDLGGNIGRDAPETADGRMR
jgi:hypothetical protein